MTQTQKEGACSRCMYREEWQFPASISGKTADFYDNRTGRKRKLSPGELFWCCRYPHWGLVPMDHWCWEFKREETP